MTESKTAAPADQTARDRLIIALDVESGQRARELARELSPFAGAFKIGLQLFVSAGPEFVRSLCEDGYRIFLDLKFHDIPNTVAKAAVEATRLGVWMFNVHASGGNEMMRRAVSEVGEICEKESLKRPKMIGVTVLTSSAGDALRENGIEGTAADQVLHLARLAKAAGLDGVVASPQECRAIKAELGAEFMVVTPGIRPTDASNDDQKRVMTPDAAIASGSDYLVIGRPITKAQNMKLAAGKVLEAISIV